MRIAVYHNLPSGGAKRALYEWTHRLARCHHVDEYSLSTAETSFCGLRRHVRATRVKPFDRRWVFPRAIDRLNRWQRWRELEDLERVTLTQAVEIDRKGYDLVFVNPCLVTTIPVILPHLRSRTVCVLHRPVGRAATVHPRADATDDASWRVTADRMDPLRRLYRDRLQRLQTASVEAADVLLASSLFTRSQMRVAYRREAPVCPGGVDTMTFQPQGPPADSPHVLSVGTLSPAKEMSFLVEAIGRIPEERRPALRLACHTVVASERRRVERLADELDVELEIRQKLDAPALAREYSLARLYVHAPGEEPFGLAPLEAMACERPVVGVREGAVAERVVDEHTGRLVERDPAAFAEATDELLQSPLRLEEWGRAARGHVQTHWTWDRSVDALERQFRAAA